MKKSHRKGIVTFDYRPLVSFLTSTIDECLVRDAELCSGGTQDNIGQLAELTKDNRRRMDRAILALEKTIELILCDLEDTIWDPAEVRVSSEKEEISHWLDSIFPDDEEGRKLLKNFSREKQAQMAN